MNVVFDTSALRTEHRAWLMLWTDLVFESPAVFDGQRLSYEDVATLLTRDLVSYSAEIGIQHFYERFLTLKLKVSSLRCNSLSPLSLTGGSERRGEIEQMGERVAQRPAIRRGPRFDRGLEISQSSSGGETRRFNGVRRVAAIDHLPTR
jgi:hypothetical protein